MNKVQQIITGVVVVGGIYGATQYYASSKVSTEVEAFMQSEEGEKFKAVLGGDFEYESAGISSTFSPVIREVKIKNPSFGQVGEILIEEIEIASMETNDFDITLSNIMLDKEIPEEMNLTIRVKSVCSDSDKCEFKATVSAMDTSISVSSSMSNSEEFQDAIKNIQESKEFDEMRYMAAIESLLVSITPIIDKFQRANNYQNYFTNTWNPAAMPKEISFKEEKGDTSEMVAAKKMLKHIFSTDMSASIELKLGNDLINVLLEKLEEESQTKMGPFEQIIFSLYSRLNTANISIDVNEEGTSLEFEITGTDGLRLKEEVKAKLPNLIEAMNKIALATSHKDIKSIEKGVKFSIEAELESDGFELTSIEEDILEEIKDSISEESKALLEKVMDWMDDHLATITKLNSNSKIEFNLEDKVITVKSELESDLLDYEVSFETSIEDERNPILINLMTGVELKELKDVLESAAETFMPEDEYEEFQEMRSVSVSEEAIKKEILNEKKRYGKGYIDNALSIFGYDDIDEAAEEISDFIKSPSEINISFDNSEKKFSNRELTRGNKESISNLSKILKVELN